MFKTPRSPEVFLKDSTKKQLKEEKALIKLIRQELRQNVIAELSIQSGGQLPQDQEVEDVLDYLIEGYREQGIIERTLERYLQKKIAEERAQFGIDR